MNEITSKRNHLKWVLPILILLIAAFGARTLVKSHRAPEKKPQINAGILVETLQVVRQTERAIVHATGIAEPLQEISVVAEVSGKLTWLSPVFVEGGFFRKGEKLLAIDPRDSRLAIEKATADLAHASSGLQTEEELASIAQREWQQLVLSDKGTPGALVLRKPQLKSAKAALAAAQAALDLANLNLQRTSLYAPFNGRVRSKKVDLGEYIRSGDSLAVFAGTDRTEIIVPLPLADLRWLKIPTAGSAQKGSLSRVSALIGSERYTWQGTINRSFGEIDSTSRMAKIAISVDDPYRLMQKDADQGISLSNGLFVDIEIEGESLEQVVSIPRNALREGDVVWLADSNDQLEIRPVRVLRRQGLSLLIDQGLNGGERLILTNISGSAKGLKLRPQAREQRQ